MAWTHRLTDIDTDSQTGTCAHCGPVSLSYRKDRDRWTCAVGRRTQRGQAPAPVVRERIGKRRQGLTVVQVEAMCSQQDGKCAICSGDITEESHVDHCHETGRIRGLLCHHCNVGLGFFRDNPAALRAAALYLEQ